MGRQEKMKEQRERMEARRKRLREAAQKATEAKKATKDKKPTPAEKKPAKNPALYVNRATSLEAHQKLVKARKALKGGSNVGPVANAAAYGEQLKKPKGQNIGPVKSGAEYARSLTKGRSAGGSTPPAHKPKASTPPAHKPAASTSSGQANTGTGRDGKFGAGTYGKGRPSDGKPVKPMPSNPKLKSQDTSHLTGRQKIALEVAKYDGPKSSHKRAASRKPTNPKKGDTYTTWTGVTMVWTGKNWKQKTK